MELTAGVREQEGSGAAAAATTLLPPRLRPGTELLGPYPDGAYDQQRYIVRRPDGQLILVSEPLYAIIRRLDGCAGVPEIASAVSTDLGKSVDPSMLETLISSRLAPLGLVGEDVGGEPSPRPKNALLSLSMRCTLLPPVATRFVGRMLAPLFSPVLVAYAIVTALGMDAWFFTSQSFTHDLVSVAANPRAMALMIGIYLLSVFFHECGHAAAAVRGGGRPGRIGMGIYVFIPAFFTDVSDTYRLDRVGRLRTDLGGVYFNVLGTVVTGFVLAGTRAPVLGVAFVLVQLGMLEQLLPLVRLDGYFVLGDLVGVPDLFSRVRPSLGALLPRRRRPERRADLHRGARAVITIWSLVVFPVLGAASVLLFLRLPLMARTSLRSARAEWEVGVAAAQHGDIVTLAVVAFSLIALAVPFVGIAILFLRAAGSTLIRLIRRAI